ncbi:MAG: 30S ribosomal protein S2 [Proteobacteria bacterium]|nr:30S ribosomal protein S2 [Pseudomonadota bacterium]
MSNNLPKFTMRQLLDAGVHFGHKTLRWNPRMKPYIFGVRNDIHIIDLQQTVPMLYNALNALYQVAARNGRILFVGTKHQAAEHIKEAAERSGQHFVNHRWLGGMLTNWKTVSGSIRYMAECETILNEERSTRSKKELLQIEREKIKLEKSLGGIRNMGGTPDIVFVIDTNKEDIAIAEARRLGIPIVAVLDSNSDPSNIDFPIPGNDDASRAIKLYCDLASDAILAGIEQALSNSGVDIGASEKPNEVANDDGDKGGRGKRPAGKKEAKVVPTTTKKKPGKSSDKEEAKAAS